MSRTAGDGTALASTLPSAFDLLDEVGAAARAGGLALFFDYDGTLTPIVSRPEDAELSEDARGVLARLTAVARVAVISGRDLDDVAQRVGVPGVTYSGSHGFETEHADGRRVSHPEGESYLRDLADAYRALNARVASVPGVIIERKRFAVAMHYRLAPADAVPSLSTAIEEVARQHPRLRVTEGKQVRELRPALEWGKGHIVEALIGSWQPRLAVFVGDDVTDEDAFAALRSQGVGIIVTADDRHTAASHRLDGVADVLRWVEALIGRAQG